MSSRPAIFPTDVHDWFWTIYPRRKPVNGVMRRQLINWNDCRYLAAIHGCILQAVCPNILPVQCSVREPDSIVLGCSIGPNHFVEQSMANDTAQIPLTVKRASSFRRWSQWAPIFRPNPTLLDQCQCDNDKKAPRSGESVVWWLDH
ncbi:hypothetical protein J1614_009405 [Plenodomus biglobosus]|nr:hypothetical protein J1614_009405 [Plenodomus biglobosus]